MKQTILFLLLFLMTATATAQVKGLGFGPRAGVNFADYKNSPGRQPARSRRPSGPDKTKNRPGGNLDGF